MRLTIPQLSMLARFAVLSELEQEGRAPDADLKVSTRAMLCYARTGSIEGLDCWWAFLSEMAREWLQQRHTQ